MYAIVVLFLWLFIAGYFLPKIFNRRIAITIAWLQGLGAVVFVYVVTFGAFTPLIRMLLLVGTLFLSMKSVVYACGKVNSGLSQWFCFAFLWIGMNPGFMLYKRKEKTFPVRLFKMASINIVLGLGLLYLVRLLQPYPGCYYPAWLLCLIGFSMVFHFGILNLLVVGWRVAGIRVQPPFRSPFYSKSLSRFWGKDWNRAFVEMTTTTMYRPLYNVLGGAKALLLTFFVSGIFHEIAIAMPVNAGFGRPLAYFLLQAGFIFLERKCIQRFPKAMKTYGRLYLFAALLLPLPLLFPPMFTHSVLFSVVKFIF